MFSILTGIGLANTALFADPFVLTIGPVTSTAGVDDQRINTSVSEQLLVTTTSLLNLTYDIPASGSGPNPSNCMFGSTGNGFCQGTRNDSSFISNAPAAFVNLGGDYTFWSGGGSNNFGPVCGFQPFTSCSFSLEPGLYTFTTSIADDLGGSNGATALPYSEGFSGILTVTSGNVQVFVAEPATGTVLLFSAGAGWLIKRRRFTKVGR